MAGIRDLLQPAPVDPRDDQQIERVLKWILTIGIAGIVVIAVLAIGRPSGLRIPFFGIGVLAAFAALAAGAALGLLFGLPWRSQRVTVVASDAATNPAPSETAAGVPSPTQKPVPESWYEDNTSLEQIAQWLTTSIVALTLVNYDGWVGRFETAAKTITCGMYEGVLLPPTGRTPPVPPESVVPLCGPAPGGIILATYAILGFLAGYLWARRYLMKELSRARADELNERLAAEQKWVSRASASGLVQSHEQTFLGDEERMAAEVTESAPLGEQPAVAPGPVPNDPWKGQFGGKTFNDKVLLSATVTPLVSRPGLYRIELTVRAVETSMQPVLANKAARIYLHPTFPNPVRAVQFDLTGQIRLPLIAYGAFTVGVQLWDGSRVELDLSQLPDAPPEFRAR